MQKVFATPTPVSLTIEIGAGSVSVQATRTTETVVRVDGPRADDVVVEQRGDEIVVLGRDADRGWGFLGGRAPLDVVVSAPAGSNLLAQTASARLTTDGRIGAARIRSASGEIRVEEIGRDGIVESGSGTIEVRTAVGDLRLKAGSGDIAIGRAGSGLEAVLGSGSIEVESVGGRVSLRSGSGDIRVREAASDLEAMTASGDIAIEQVRGGAIKATTASGDVRVGVGAEIPVWTDIRTISGEIRSDLRGAGQPQPGQGHVEIHVSTVSGDVTLREVALREVAAVTAAPDPGAVTIQ